MGTGEEGGEGKYETLLCIWATLLSDGEAWGDRMTGCIVMGRVLEGFICSLSR